MCLSGSVLLSAPPDGLFNNLIPIQLLPVFPGCQIEFSLHGYSCLWQAADSNGDVWRNVLRVNKIYMIMDRERLVLWLLMKKAAIMLLQRLP